PKSDNKIIQNHLMIIVQLKSTVTYPYLLRLFDMYYGEKQISTEQFVNILTVINSYLIRRAIVNFPTNALNKVFSNLGKEANKKKDIQSEEDRSEEHTSELQSRFDIVCRLLL